MKNTTCALLLALALLPIAMNGQSSPYCTEWISFQQDPSEITGSVYRARAGDLFTLPPNADTNYTYRNARVLDNLHWTEFDSVVVASPDDILNYQRRIPLDIITTAIRDGDSIRSCVNRYSVRIDDVKGLGPRTEIKGRVHWTNACGSSEQSSLAGIPVTVLNAADLTTTTEGVTDESGAFSLYVDGGVYLVDVQPDPKHWTTCQQIRQIAIDTNYIMGEFGPLNIPAAIDLGAFQVSPTDSSCVDLKVDISTFALRACFNTPYRLSYANAGSALASEVVIDLMLDTPIAVDSASLDYEVLESGNLRFAIGDLDIGQGGSIDLYVHLPCDLDLVGRTFCAEAEISAANHFKDGFQGAILSVEGECRGDSVFFRISNTGNMSTLGSVQYVVVEDITSFAFEHDPLGVGDFFELTFPANGATYRVEVRQEGGNPRGAFDARTIEGCADGMANGSLGFHTMLPKPDQAMFIAIHCRESTASFDPNDKTTFPKGLGEDRGIEPNEEIEYQIRFQNTGTDTAFRVEIIDAMSQELDPQTLQFGASSHPYTMEREGPIIKFVFADILLPDSITNEGASHGFVNYKVRPREETTVGDTLSNKALIYFDFNAPIETNRTLLVLQERILTTKNKDADFDRQDIRLFPNPVIGNTLTLSEELQHPGSIILYNAFAQQVKVLSIQGNSIAIGSDLPSGIYYYQIVMDKVQLSRGKLMIP